MGKGIALEFKRRFGGVSELLAQGVGIGGVATLQLGVGQFAYYLVTKERYFHKPTLSSLAACVRELARLCDEAGVEELNLPRLGCGLDRLAWSDVRDVLQREFAQSGVKQIRVYTL